jgi:hypothetical protein
VQQKLGCQVMFPPSNGMGLLRRGKVAGMLIFTSENVTPVPHLVSMSVWTPQFHDEVMLLLFEILPLADDLSFDWLLSNIEKRFPLEW